MLHTICITKEWSTKQMMFKDQDKNSLRGVCAPAKMQPCFQLCSNTTASNSLQQRCGADEQPTTGRWLLREASGRRLVISFRSHLKIRKDEINKSEIIFSENI